ncbi:cation channel sperm-associated auxiliary subunit epsilon-like [Branchiostoma floridae x Branchiostoma belcheri]
MGRGNRSLFKMDDECLAVWTDTQVYLKTSSQNSLELTSLPTVQLGASGYNNHSVPILDVSFSSHPEELGVLVHVQTSGGEDKVMIIQYDLSTAVWSLPESTMEYRSAGNFTLVYLASALPEAFVWDPASVTYSFSNGTGTLQILEGNVTSNLIEAPLESIQEITAGPNGDFVIHLTSNKLYYGRVDKESVIELTPGELPEAEFVLYFDMLGRLHLVTYDSSSNSASVRLFPLQAEVYSSLYPDTSCPYYRFSHNFDVDGYYIDVGEELQIWASLMYPNGSYNSVEVLVRDGHLLQQNFSSEILPSSLYTTENMTLHLSSNVTFEMLQTEDSGSIDGTTGVMMIEVRPKQTSYVCQGPVNVVTSISVGCPPNRHIRVRRPSRKEACSSYQNYIYTLSADMYDPTYKGESAESSKDVTYDLDNLGCPIDVFYSDKFRPTVDLYDGDQFVHEVKEDYFVWEAHGRTGYAYSTTMQQAGCVCEAQTLSGMLTAGNVSSPDEAWGPQNYRPCSTPCDPAGSLSGQYEVLSSLGVSALTFGSNKGIFVFNLKVLDPECSYCVLQTQFAVRVYGSPQESLNLYVYISVLAFILGTVVILVLTYYRYYKLMAEEHQKLLQELTNKEEEDGRGEEDGEGEKEEEKEEEIM